jgi:kynureninase
VTATQAPTDRSYAEALDADDPLAAFRERFVIGDPGLIYLEGNSLGRLPRSTQVRLRQLVESEWGRELIDGWDRWLDLPVSVGDLIGTELLGARPGEVVMADSTTVNFYRLAVAALNARQGRHTIVTDRPNFPTDRYVLQGLAWARDLQIRWLDPDPVEGTRPGDVAAALDGDVALVTLSLVNYRSSALADLPAITRLAHEAGALVLWDLSHAVGSVPVGLEEHGADLAVGCTYKYLNAGPGSPAFLYVRSELQDELRNPVQGWFGQRNQFAMGPDYDREPGIRGWLAGTPAVLGLAAVEEGAMLCAEAGIEAIRAKGTALTELAIALHDAWLAPASFGLGSPRDPARRGAHVALRHGDGRRLSERLATLGVKTDFREPDSIRVGCSPLTTRFTDVWDGLSRLRELTA